MLLDGVGVMRGHAVMGSCRELRREQREQSAFTSLCVYPPAKPNALPVQVPFLKTTWISPWPSRLSL